MVNIGNMILLKQTTACSYQPGKGWTWGPRTRLKAVQAAHLPAAHCHSLSETLYSITYYYRNSYMTHPPGQCRRKRKDVNLLVEGGTTVMQANHIKSNKHTMPDPKPNFKGFIKTKSRLQLKYVFPNASNTWRERGGRECFWVTMPSTCLQ